MVKKEAFFGPKPTGGSCSSRHSTSRKGKGERGAGKGRITPDVFSITMIAFRQEGAKGRDLLLVGTAAAARTNFKDIPNFQHFNLSLPLTCPTMDTSAPGAVATECAMGETAATEDAAAAAAAAEEAAETLLTEEDLSTIRCPPGTRKVGELFPPVTPPPPPSAEAGESEEACRAAAAAGARRWDARCSCSRVSGDAGRRAACGGGWEQVGQEARSGVEGAATPDRVTATAEAPTVSGASPIPPAAAAAAAALFSPPSPPPPFS